MRTVSSTTIAPDDVGQDLPRHHEQPRLAAQPGRRDVVELGLGEHGGAHGAGDDRREQHGDRADDDDAATTPSDETIEQADEDRPGSTAGPR